MSEVGKWPRTAAVFGASGGIGAALARTLAEQGCERVYAFSRAGLKPAHRALETLPFDLTDEAKTAAVRGHFPTSLMHTRVREC
ncbi:MAG: NAD-dependent epimerase/dehydratase family protein, partial [Pseudomonadota bacterium]